MLSSIIKKDNKSIGITFRGYNNAVSDVLEANGKEVQYNLFTCYGNGTGYAAYLQYSDDNSTWVNYTYAGGDNRGYAGSYKQGKASGHKYWRIKAGSTNNDWVRGGAVFII